MKRKKSEKKEREKERDRERERKREREKERTKSKFSCSIFLTVRWINGTVVVYFTLEYAQSFVSFCFVYLGAARIPYVQDGICAFKFTFAH